MFALPSVPAATARIAAVTLAPVPESSLVNHSKEPNVCPSTTVMSVSVNLIVGCPALASLEIQTLPAVFKLAPVMLAPTAKVEVTLAVPVMFAPVLLTTNTLLVPLTDISALLPADGISIDVVPC